MTISKDNMTANTDETRMEDDEKPRTIFVGNVPREIHKREIEDIFGEIGPLKRCYIQYPRTGNEKKRQTEDSTVAYVTFALSQDATKAIETLQNSQIGGNQIHIKFVKTRGEQNRRNDNVTTGNFPTRILERSANFEPLTPKEKPPREKTAKKKSRLIVRNLPWKVTDESLKEHFQQYGEVKDVNILKKPNGKLVGCAFIQYATVFQAAKAIKELNLKSFIGRPIAIDWALPKDKYQTEDEKNKAKAPEEETVEIKEEAESELEDHVQFDHYAHLKEEQVEVETVKEEPVQIKKLNKRKHADSEEDEETCDDDDNSDSETDDGKTVVDKKKRLSNDVNEGKTLFLRNLAFDTKEDNLRVFFEKFGEIHYALLCKDSLTEHPKGTGFVKFKEKNSADNCLQKYEEDPSEFKLQRREFVVSVAIAREKLENRTQEKKQEKPKSDGRNLFLVREGFIRPGSAAVADVSQSDINKRASLNRVKKQMLKNLNIFISPTRLCVHNLPPTFTDKQLKKLFIKNAGAGAKITEARIMRDMKNMSLNAVGKSKEYGFINFSTHEHSLTALRTINNNPSIFSANHRPIVEFSLENRAALKAKERRSHNSKMKNLKQSNSEDAAESNQSEEDSNVAEETAEKKRIKKEEKKASQNSNDSLADKDQTIAPYAGLVAKKGVQTIPLMKPKGKITRNSLKMKRTKKKKLQERKQREPKVPAKRSVDRPDNTEKIIRRHQRKLTASSKGESEKASRKKWYE